MVPLILLLRLTQALLSLVLPRPRPSQPRTAPPRSALRAGDIVRVGADARRWRVAELYPPHGLGLEALDAERFIVLNHAQLSRITCVGH